MELSYAWIPTCRASDAKVICQAITGLIGGVGENMKLEEVHRGRDQGTKRTRDRENGEQGVQRHRIGNGERLLAVSF